MSLQWWEKTVEYLFVLRVAELKNLYLAPLDSNQERAGDAVFSSGNRWVLIEFKKNKASISTEKSKFISYTGAYATFSSRDDHHCIVYGQEGSKGSTQFLDLRFQTYFSEKERNLADVLSSGIKYDAFKEYVAQYTKFKKTPKSGSGGGVTMDNLALVAGVNTDNKIVECLSLTEFQRQLDLVHEKKRLLYERKHEHKIEGRGYGGR